MTKSKFTAAEKKKIHAVLVAQESKFWAGLSTSGYNNSDGGCPNCGETGGFYNVMYQLRKAFGIKTK